MNFSNIRLALIGLYVLYNSFHKYFYVGQSTNLGNRLPQHQNDLKQKRHKNYLFQKHYNEIVSNKLDPLEYIFLKPVYYFVLEKNISSSDSEKLNNVLLQKEFEIAKELSKRGYQIYNDLNWQIGERNSFFNQKHTEATKIKMQKARAKQKNISTEAAVEAARKSNSIAVRVDGVVYENHVILAAAKGIGKSTAEKRTKKDNTYWPTWVRLKDEKK